MVFSKNKLLNLIYLCSRFTSTVCILAIIVFVSIAIGLGQAATEKSKGSHESTDDGDGGSRKKKLHANNKIQKLVTKLQVIIATGEEQSALMCVPKLNLVKIL